MRRLLLIISFFSIHLSAIAYDFHTYRLTLFPTKAFFQNGSLHIPVHGQLVQYDQDSLWRKLFIKAIKNYYELDLTPNSSEIFTKRFMEFLADPVEKKTITIQIENMIDHLTTDESGHFETIITRPEPDFFFSEKSSFNVIAHYKSRRPLTAQIEIFKEKYTGIMVVSDIDDTIKKTYILDKARALQATFLEEFEAVPGMSTLYQNMARKGVSFHYLSGSPWQLFQPLKEFLQSNGFPIGSIDLLNFNYDISNIMNIYINPTEYKLLKLSQLLRRFPMKKFILIGDSGELDPEIYTQIYREYPEQIIKILIRKVRPESPEETERFEELLQNIPYENFSYIDETKEIAEEIFLSHFLKW